MKKYSSYSSLIVILVMFLSACVTINIYFPAAAAEKAADKDIKDFLLKMAAMEAKHIEIFRQMRQELGDKEKESDIYDPDNQAMQYLQAMADSRGYEGRVSPTEMLTGNESIKEILEIALNAEKESVVFYYGLKSLVSEKAGKDKVEKIILEELNHISTLLKYLKELN